MIRDIGATCINVIIPENLLATEDGIYIHREQLSGIGQLHGQQSAEFDVGSDAMLSVQIRLFFLVQNLSHLHD